MVHYRSLKNTGIQSEDDDIFIFVYKNKHGFP